MFLAACETGGAETPCALHVLRGQPCSESWKRFFKRSFDQFLENRACEHSVASPMCMFAFELALQEDQEDLGACGLDFSAFQSLRTPESLLSFFSPLQDNKLTPHIFLVSFRARARGKKENRRGEKKETKREKSCENREEIAEGCSSVTRGVQGN